MAVDISKIAHLADIHIKKSPSRHEEYREVFGRTYKSLEERKPDRILIAGDLVHDYIDMQPELMILASEFLNNLAKITKVIITRGNHDIRKNNLKRVDAIEAIVRSMDNENILYLNETGFFEDENIVWCVWKHGTKKNSPWEIVEHTKDKTKTYIDIFHDPINGARSPDNFEFKSKVYKGLSQFKGDFLFAGDIHKKQFLDKNKAYCGSLVCQNYGEGDGDFHGYLFWDIKTGKVEEVEIENNYSFNNVAVNRFTDFNDLDIELDSKTKFNRIRVVWKTLPETRTTQNERAVDDYLNVTHSPIEIKHKSEFIEGDKIEEQTDEILESITTQTTQHKIFREYLGEIGSDDDIIEEVIKLDDEISQMTELEELTNLTWTIHRITGKNFMSYDEFDVDWSGNDGLYQITGQNTAGKTTLLKAISYALYGRSLETERRVKYGDSRFINNRTNDDKCIVSVLFECNGRYYRIERSTSIGRNKEREINKATTTVSYHTLQNLDDVISDETNVDNLTDERKESTQREIDMVLGSFDNFKRTVLTTSDTLNESLSTDPAIFTDSLLYDSGLDVFDKKFESFKNYEKAINSGARLKVDLDKVKANILDIEGIVDEKKDSLNDHRDNILVTLNERRKKGQEFIEELSETLFQINDVDENFDLDSVERSITTYKNEIISLEENKRKLETQIDILPSSYEEEKLSALELKKEVIKNTEFELRSENRTIESNIIVDRNSIEVINGNIKRLKQDGVKIKTEINDLKNSTNCPTCNQSLGDDHITHITKGIKGKVVEAKSIAEKIYAEENKKPSIENKIQEQRDTINSNEEKIHNNSLNSESLLLEISEIKETKDGVDKRRTLEYEIATVDPKMESHRSKIEVQEKDISIFKNNEINITKNKKTKERIAAGKQKLTDIELRIRSIESEIGFFEMDIKLKENEIQLYRNEVEEFLIQEREDLIRSTYKKCIHRSGLPTQLLKKYSIPKINKGLTDLLSGLNFDVWIDSTELKPKLAYKNRRDSVIDSISSSGKERTFASVALKYVLTLINVKSKPKLFLLDEVMGKLDEESVIEFKELLHTIKNYKDKVIIIEHNHEVDPDFIIEVSKNQDGISELVIK